MRKWTLEKILACEEIGFGTWIIIKEIKYLIHSKQPLGIPEVLALAALSFYLENIASKIEFNLQYVRVYRPDGTEILPPKDKKKIKVKGWISYFKNSDTGKTFIKYYDDEQSAREAVVCFANGIMYERFEREIEVIDNE